jgi:predicted extracellular nuclease
MTNLFKSLSLIVAVVFISSSAAFAGFTASGNPTSVGSISVYIRDNAKNACWTNLREAREYAEEKLKIKGYNVLANEAGRYNFEIEVNAFRDSRGSCIGTYRARIYAVNWLDGVVGFHEIGENGGHGTNSDNFNSWVIEIISDMVGEM